MKCPACGFESADDAAWCDFCKEPFRKRASAPPLEPPKTNGAPDIQDFAHLDAGERIAPIPPWVRPAAWAFLAIWFIWGMVLLGYYVGKQRVAQEEKAAPAGP